MNNMDMMKWDLFVSAMTGALNGMAETATDYQRAFHQSGLAAFSTMLDLQYEAELMQLAAQHDFNEVGVLQYYRARRDEGFDEISARDETQFAITEKAAANHAG